MILSMRVASRLRAIGGVVAAFLLFELVLRQLYLGLPTWDPAVGWIYSNTELRHYIFEGWATSHWDQRGVRAIPGPPPQGRAILAIGNSVTQAAQIGDADVYTALLQRRMGMPVLNVGHDAQSIADDVFAARQRLTTFPVAWTIVQFIPLDFEETSEKPDRAHFKTVGKTLTVEPGTVRFSKLSPVTHWLRRHSGLVNLGLLRLAVLRETPTPPLFRAADPRPRDRSTSYRPVELELDALRDAYGGRATMFLVPDFLPPETSMERRFTQWCQSTGTSCVNLRSVFDEFNRRGRAPTGFPNSNFGFGHLNQEGHIAAANLLAAELERLRALGLF
jgi:hypothetical protein